LGITGLCLLLAWGCANPCQGEGAKVEEALTKARAQKADEYASAAYGRASASLKLAQEECAKQEARFFLFRSYRPAQALFNTALQEAEAVASQSGTVQGMARQEALNARYEAGMAVNEAVVSLGRAREMQGQPVAQELVGRLDALKAGLVALEGKIDAGDYLPARDLAFKIRDEAIRLQADANRGALAAPTP
jgi:hypothetical protein